MEKSYSNYWWSFLLRGIIAILFGLVAFLLPTVTIDILVLLVGAFFFADGVLAIFASFGGKGGKPWWISMLEGIAGISIGILTFFWPEITLIAAIILIAAWALITGIFEIVAAIQLRKEISGEWFLGLSGLISVLLGLILFGMPGVGAVALVWVLGAYAIFFGILLLSLGFKLRKKSHV